jgi:TIR domain-containing protein
MAKDISTVDVFMSYSQRDAALADEMAGVLRSLGLNVFPGAGIAKGQNTEDAIWEAMAESKAVLAIVKEEEPSASILFELGAAKAWNKPVYFVAANPSARLPAGVRGMTIYPPSRIEEIGQEIKRHSHELSEADRAVLVEEYHRIGVPVDQLALQPKYLSRLTKQFKKRAKREIASEELVRTLLLLRKRGALGMSNAKRRPKAS